MQAKVREIAARVFRRFSKLSEEQKDAVVKKVQENLAKSEGDAQAGALPEAPPDGMVVLLDEEVKTARSRSAMKFDTRKEYEEYKKTHKIKPNTKVEILEESGGKGQKEDPSKTKKAPKKTEPKTKKAPPKTKAPKKPVKTEAPKDSPSKEAPPKAQADKPSAVSQLKDLTSGGSEASRQIAVKDAMIEQFGKDAAGWDAHKIHKSQLTKGVLVRFPDGTAKSYGDLTDDEKKRVQDALDKGLASSKGINDYNGVDAGTYKRNMARNLAAYDDASVQEKKVESADKVSPKGAAKLASAISTNARSVIQKYSSAMSSVSRPMLENYVDKVASAVSEAVSDGSLANVSEADVDEMVRDDVKRMIHQEVETRRRSLGDHGIRHATQNAVNSMSMLDELQSSGMKVTGKDKLMAVAIQANHDNGYTVGDVATDISKGKKHKEYSAKMAGDEAERYAKVFGEDGAATIKEIIGSHDENKISWTDDPVGSSVRLSDATALFGKEKVQDLFIRSPKAMDLVCRLRLAAEAEPDNTELQDAIKKQMHEAVDKAPFDDVDKELLHNQVSEMSEGKFSTTADILSRYSGKVEGFKYDPKRSVMKVNMKYSPEGEMVDSLFGDEVAAKQFGKFAEDMDGHAVRGKKGKTLLRSGGKPAVEVSIDGFDKEPVASASTKAMKEFGEKTARTEINMARRQILPPPETIRKSAKEALKHIEKARDKFDDEEWAKMKELFKKYKGEKLVEALRRFPLLKSEKEYLMSKFPGIELQASVSARVAMSWRVASGFVAKRGLQVRRKDKDLMSDTGGISKVREREPEKKPPREDMKKPHRTKDKPAPERDRDTDEDVTKRDVDTDLDRDVRRKSHCDTRRWRFERHNRSLR